MEHIGWTDDFIIGEATIDIQHKELLNISKEILGILLVKNVTILDEGSKKAAMLLLDNLENKLAEHFEYEEELLKKHQCELADLNIQEHKFYNHRLNTIKELVIENGFTVENVRKLELLVDKMLIRHMLEVDIKMSKYFK